MQQLEEQLAVLQKNFAAVMSENLQRTHEVDEARAAAKAEAVRASEAHSAALSAAEQRAQAHAGADAGGCGWSCWVGCRRRWLHGCVVWVETLTNCIMVGVESLL